MKLPLDGEAPGRAEMAFERRRRARGMETSRLQIPGRVASSRSRPTRRSAPADDVDIAAFDGRRGSHTSMIGHATPGGDEVQSPTRRVVGGGQREGEGGSGGRRPPGLAARGRRGATRTARRPRARTVRTRDIRTVSEFLFQSVALATHLGLSCRWRWEASSLSCPHQRMRRESPFFAGLRRTRERRSDGRAGSIPPEYFVPVSCRESHPRSFHPAHPFASRP